MPAAAAAVLVLLGAGAVLALYALVVVLVAPYVIYTLLTGFVVGLLFGLADAATVLTGRDVKGSVSTPRQAFLTGIGDRKLPSPRDYAWPQYFVRQIGHDLHRIGHRLLGHVALLWRRGWRLVPRLPRYHVRILGYFPEYSASDPQGRARTWTILLGWPLLAVPAAGLAGLTVGVAAVAAAVVAVFAVVTAGVWAVGLSTVGLRSQLSRLRRRVRRTASCCTRCYFVIELPVFACPGPHPPTLPAGSERHRDLRPGLQGVWRRRCGCGVLLPTSLPRAAKTLAPSCPKCGEGLPTGAGLVTEARIAVFGAATAGKTVLIEAGLADLPRRLEPVGVSMTRVEPRVAPGGDKPSSRPVAVTSTIRRGARDTVVHLFDAPGAGLVDREVCASYAYLDEVRNFLFVLDPFSIAAVQRRLAAVPPHLVPALATATHDPVDSYEAVVVGLRHRGVDTYRCRLAFVVTKADVLAVLPDWQRLESGSSTAVQRWLDDQGLDQLVFAAHRDFSDIRFFLSGSGADQDRDPSAPLAWLLAQDRIIPAGGARRERG